MAREVYATLFFSILYAKFALSAGIELRAVGFAHGLWL